MIRITVIVALAMAAAGCLPPTAAKPDEYTGLVRPVDSEYWRRAWLAQYYSPLADEVLQGSAYGAAGLPFERTYNFRSFHVLEGIEKAALVRGHDVVWAGTQIVVQRVGGRKANLYLFKDTQDAPVHEGTMYHLSRWTPDDPYVKFGASGVCYVPVDPGLWLFDADHDGNDEVIIAHHIDEFGNGQPLIFLDRVRWGLRLEEGNGFAEAALPEGLHPEQVIIECKEDKLILVDAGIEAGRILGEFRKEDKKWVYVPGKAMPDKARPATAPADE